MLASPVSRRLRQEHYKFKAAYAKWWLWGEPGSHSKTVFQCTNHEQRCPCQELDLRPRLHIAEGHTAWAAHPHLSGSISHQHCWNPLSTGHLTADTNLKAVLAAHSQRIEVSLRLITIFMELHSKNRTQTSKRIQGHLTEFPKTKLSSDMCTQTCACVLDQSITTEPHPSQLFLTQASRCLKAKPRKHCFCKQNDSNNTIIYTGSSSFFIESK